MATCQREIQCYESYYLDRFHLYLRTNFSPGRLLSLSLAQQKRLASHP